jgi:hypothetical protein
LEYSPVGTWRRVVGKYKHGGSRRAQVGNLYQFWRRHFYIINACLPRNPLLATDAEHTGFGIIKQKLVLLSAEPVRGADFRHLFGQIAIGNAYHVYRDSAVGVRSRHNVYLDGALRAGATANHGGKAKKRKEAFERISPNSPHFKSTPRRSRSITRRPVRDAASCDSVFTGGLCAKLGDPLVGRLYRSVPGPCAARPFTGMPAAFKSPLFVSGRIFTAFTAMQRATQPAQCDLLFLSPAHEIAYVDGGSSGHGSPHTHAL